ncbi:MAG: hypothetical protein KGS60_19055 [Verrucomicrobia bacterium]|nr:hypothetical protein [Verrucomicrobiota bacterium]
MNTSRIEITRYGTRNWAVWLDGELLAVTVYKKGATAVVNTITKLLQRSRTLASPNSHER